VDPSSDDGISFQPQQNQGNLFFMAGISPKLQAVQPVQAHQLAEFSWPWTPHLLTAPSCNQTKQRKIWFSRPRPQL
jgi:hypothetical protein